MLVNIDAPKMLGGARIWFSSRSRSSPPDVEVMTIDPASALELFALAAASTQALPSRE